MSKLYCNITSQTRLLQSLAMPLTGQHLWSHLSSLNNSLQVITIRVLLRLIGLNYPVFMVISPISSKGAQQGTIDLYKMAIAQAIAATLTTIVHPGNLHWQ